MGRAGTTKPAVKKHWIPSERSFGALLAWLDGDVDSGGERYLEMRRRLSAYFERRKCDCPDDLADDTLNRVARRLEEVGGRTDGPPARYCYIVAKFVFLEYLRARDTGPRDASTHPQRLESGVGVVSLEPDGQQQRLACFERCLDKLPPHERELILEYYTRGEGRTADCRRALAARFDLTMNALAIRACRIRDTLEACVRSCEVER
jgi:DNA-directed RNA polymerase specialized sigma24 family protein